MDLLDSFQKKMQEARDTYITQPLNRANNWVEDLRSFTGEADAEAER